MPDFCEARRSLPTSRLHKTNPAVEAGCFRLAAAIVNSFFDWYIRIPTFFCCSIAEKVFMRSIVTRESTARLKRGLRCAGTSRSGR
jgi:hypothetical protein